jgi:hypothetical protein
VTGSIGQAKVGAKGRKVDKELGHRRKWELVERLMIQVVTTDDVSDRHKFYDNVQHTLAKVLRSSRL